MSPRMIGRLRRVPLREVWPHEARDFTVWLRDNVEVLNEVLRREFSNAEAERSAGPFSVDLVAEDEQGNPVIIENQIEKSDHDHLGKIVTYLTALDAKTAVWIVAEPRPEHIRAISWLNESPNADFYLLQLEAVQIEDSSPAPLLTLIVGPSEESREIGKSKKEFSERHQVRWRFWESLLQRASKKTALHAKVSPSRDNWVVASAGVPGLVFGYAVLKSDARVELYIDRGDASENTRVFKELFSHRDEIEKAFGRPLIWDSMEGRRACRIKANIDIGGLADESRWSSIQDAMIDAMVSLEKALKPQIDKLRL